MIKYFKKIFKNKLFIIFIIVLIIFLPSTITRPAESEEKVLVVAMGFDKKDDKVEVSAQFVVPQFAQGFNMTLKLTSAIADTPASAVDKISLQLGKKIGLAHCDVIAVGSGYNNEDIGKTFDYLIRGKKIGRSSVLIYTTGTAKQLLNESNNLNKNFSVNLKQILNFNEKYLYAKQNTVDNFLSKYFDDQAVSYISVVDVEKGGESGGEQGGESGGSGNSSQQNSESSSQTSQSAKVPIVNDGKTAIFKKGKIFCILEPVQVRQFSWLKNSSTVVINLKNVNTDVLTNAEMVIEAVEKTFDLNLSFKNNKPVVNAKLNLVVQLNSVKNEDQKEISNINKMLINDEVQKLIKEFIYKDISSAVAYAKENKTDLFYFYDKFYKFKNKELMNYVKTLENPEDFISDLQLFTEINIDKTV